MNAEIVMRLDAMAIVRLFGDGRWLVDHDVADALGKAITAMGLQEQVSEDTAMITALGKAVNLDLQMVFLGMLEPPDMIDILDEYQLLEEGEADQLFALLERGENYELVLKARVQQAYRDHYKAKLQ